MALSAEAIAALEDRLALYLQAEADVLRNQSYKMPNGREMTRADLTTIRAGIADLRNEIAGASGTPIVKGRARRAYGILR